MKLLVIKTLLILSTHSVLIRLYCVSMSHLRYSGSARVSQESRVVYFPRRGITSLRREFCRHVCVHVFREKKNEVVAGWHLLAHLELQKVVLLQGSGLWVISSCVTHFLRGSLPESLSAYVGYKYVSIFRPDLQSVALQTERGERGVLPDPYSDLHWVCGVNCSVTDYKTNDEEVQTDLNTSELFQEPFHVVV